MNKTSKLFAGFAALALMASCSSDEPLTGGETGGAPVTPVEGQKAYLNVKISDAGNMPFGRSTDFETPSYEFGDADEHKVNNARFFFFDENGIKVAEAGLTPVVDVDNPGGSDGDFEKNPNIEYFVNNVLVLEDLKSNTYPKYMLTVLNKKDFEPEPTLQATCDKLVNFATDEKSQNFVMSTTSYFKGAAEDKNHDDKYYGVTMLDEGDFKTTPTEAQNMSPVNVYVERLAAKVQLTMDVEDGVITLDGGRKLYPLAQTVAGMPNEDGNGEWQANTKIYVEVIGWSLNATANNSHMTKDISNWSSNDVFTAWNNASLYRSFWGAAAETYGLTGTTLENNLTYINDKALTGKLTNEDSKYAQYCYENTNTPVNIFAQNAAEQNLVIPSHVTHIVLATRICDAEGNEIPALNVRGMLYTEESFRAYLLNVLKNQTEGLNYYYVDGTEEVNGTVTTKYRQVNENDIDFAKKPNTIGAATFALKSTDQLYEKTGEKDAQNNDVYAPVDGQQLVARLNVLIPSGTDLQYYKDANLYYIPVEHNTSVETANEGKAVEGYYGVVRNHWYKVSINSFSKVGHALFVPDGGEVVIRPDKPEDPLYYVGAKINILSWRVINQGVDL